MSATALSYTTGKGNSFDKAASDCNTATVSYRGKRESPVWQRQAVSVAIARREKLSGSSVESRKFLETKKKRMRAPLSRLVCRRRSVERRSRALDGSAGRSTASTGAPCERRPLRRGRQGSMPGTDASEPRHGGERATQQPRAPVRWTGVPRRRGQRHRKRYVSDSSTRRRPRRGRAQLSKLSG